MWQQYGIKLFVIDYLQLLHSTSRRAENRQQEIAEISGGLKSLAKELNVPIIVLSQLNRELEKRGPGERPRLSDLRESGAIEQDADLVGLLYRETKNKDGEEDDERSGTGRHSCETFHRQTTQWPHRGRRSDFPQELHALRERGQSQPGGCADRLNDENPPSLWRFLLGCFAGGLLPPARGPDRRADRSIKFSSATSARRRSAMISSAPTFAPRRANRLPAPTVDEDIKNLYATGYFFKIQVGEENTAGRRWI